MESEMGGGENTTKKGKRNRERSTERSPTAQEGIKGIYSCRQSLYHLSYLGSPEDRDPELPIEEETTLY